MDDSSSQRGSSPASRIGSSSSGDKSGSVDGASASLSDVNSRSTPVLGDGSPTGEEDAPPSMLDNAPRPTWREIAQSYEVDDEVDDILEENFLLDSLMDKIKHFPAFDHRSAILHLRELMDRFVPPPVDGQDDPTEPYNAFEGEIVTDMMKFLHDLQEKQQELLGPHVIRRFHDAWKEQAEIALLQSERARSAVQDQENTHLDSSKKEDQENSDSPKHSGDSKDKQGRVSDELMASIVDTTFANDFTTDNANVASLLLQIRKDEEIHGKPQLQHESKEDAIVDAMAVAPVTFAVVPPDQFQLVEHMQNLTNSSQEEVERLNGELQRLREENSSLKDRLNEASTSVTISSKRLDLTVGDLTQARQQVLALERDNAALRKSYQDLQESSSTQIELLQGHILQMRDEKESFLEEAEELKRFISAQDQVLLRQKKTSKDTMTDIELLKRKLKMSNKELRESVAVVARMTSANEKAQRESRFAWKQVGMLERELSKCYRIFDEESLSFAVERLSIPVMRDASQVPNLPPVRPLVVGSGVGGADPTDASQVIDEALRTIPAKAMPPDAIQAHAPSSHSNGSRFRRGNAAFARTQVKETGNAEVDEIRLALQMSQIDKAEVKRLRRELEKVGGDLLAVRDWVQQVEEERRTNIKSTAKHVRKLTNKIEQLQREKMHVLPQLRNEIEHLRSKLQTSYDERSSLQTQLANLSLRVARSRASGLADLRFIMTQQRPVNSLELTMEFFQQMSTGHLVVQATDPRDGGKSWVLRLEWNALRLLETASLLCSDFVEHGMRARVISTDLAIHTSPDSKSFQDANTVKQYSHSLLRFLHMISVDTTAGLPSWSKYIEEDRERDDDDLEGLSRPGSKEAKQKRKESEATHQLIAICPCKWDPAMCDRSLADSILYLGHHNLVRCTLHMCSGFSSAYIFSITPFKRLGKTAVSKEQQRKLMQSAIWKHTLATAAMKRMLPDGVRLEPNVPDSVIQDLLLGGYVAEKSFVYLVFVSIPLGSLSVCLPPTCQRPPCPVLPSPKQLFQVAGETTSDPKIQGLLSASLHQLLGCFDIVPEVCADAVVDGKLALTERQEQALAPRELTILRQVVCFSANVALALPCVHAVETFEVADNVRLIRANHDDTSNFSTEAQSDSSLLALATGDEKATMRPGVALAVVSSQGSNAAIASYLQYWGVSVWSSNFAAECQEALQKHLTHIRSQLVSESTGEIPLTLMHSSLIFRSGAVMSGIPFLICAFAIHISSNAPPGADMDENSPGLDSAGPVPGASGSFFANRSKLAGVRDGIRRTVDAEAQFVFICMNLWSQDVFISATEGDDIRSMSEGSDMFCELVYSDLHRRFGITDAAGAGSKQLDAAIFHVLFDILDFDDSQKMFKQKVPAQFWKRTAEENDPAPSGGDSGSAVLPASVDNGVSSDPTGNDENVDGNANAGDFTSNDPTFDNGEASSASAGGSSADDGNPSAKVASSDVSAGQLEETDVSTSANSDPSPNSASAVDNNGEVVHSL